MFSGLPISSGQVLADFHNQVESRAVKNGASIAAFQMLKSQIPNHKQALKDASTVAKSDIVAKQKDINREFVPTITKTMIDAYDTCNREIDSGQFVRMKAAMADHVSTVRHSMYDKSTKYVQRLLKEMLKQAEDSLHVKADEIFWGIKRDYTSVVVGQDASKKQQLLPREQRALRRGVLDIVEGAESVFKQVLGLEPEAEDEDSEEGSLIVTPQSQRIESPSAEVQEAVGLPITIPTIPQTAPSPQELAAVLEPNKVAREPSPEAESPDEDSTTEDAMPSKLEIAKAVDEGDKENYEMVDRPNTATSSQSGASQRSSGWSFSALGGFLRGAQGVFRGSQSVLMVHGLMRTVYAGSV